MARRRFAGHTSTVAHKQWTGLSGNISSMDIAANTVALGSIGLLTGLPITLLRLRGSWFIELDETAVNERVTVAVGIISVSENAFGVGGVTAVPAPITDSSEDWIWWDAATVSSGDSAAIVNTHTLGQQRMIDSKAMRKLKPGDTLAFVAESSVVIDQGGSVNIMYSLRSLAGN